MATVISQSFIAWYPDFLNITALLEALLVSRRLQLTVRVTSEGLYTEGAKWAQHPLAPLQKSSIFESATLDQQKQRKKKVPTNTYTHSHIPSLTWTLPYVQHNREAAGDYYLRSSRTLVMEPATEMPVELKF